MLNELPEYGGIYLLLRNDEVIYVGQSDNIRQRWQVHKYRPEFQDCEVQWIRTECKRLQRDRIERLLILHFTPEFNRNVPRGTRSKKRNIAFVDLRNDKRIEGALSDYLRDQLPAIGKGPAIAKLASERLRELYPARFQ